jgi:hypothetical protein
VGECKVGAEIWGRTSRLRRLGGGFCLDRETIWYWKARISGLLQGREVSIDGRGQGQSLTLMIAGGSEDVTVTRCHDDVTSERFFDDRFLRLSRIQGWATRSMLYPTTYVAALTHPTHKLAHTK